MKIQSRRVYVLLLTLLLHLLTLKCRGLQILAKSKLERCERFSGANELACSQKLVVNMAVPSGSSGREASIVAELVETENISSGKMQTMRTSPIITVEKSAAYALYEITYIRDVAYKPEELYVKTRKCESDADAKVVKECARLKDENGQIIKQTEPICCPCGPKRRVPSSCGNFLEKLLKGKANTAHCLRFPGEWFHVFSIGRRLLGFSVRIEMKKGSQKSEVVVGPENRTVLSNDNFLRVSLIGDFLGYTSIPTLEDFYLVIPREVCQLFSSRVAMSEASPYLTLIQLFMSKQGVPGQPNNLGSNFSMWMLLERVRFSLDGLECNKIGVSYEAYNMQPEFCSSPLWSCLHNQLWNFWEADQNRIKRNQSPQYVVVGRFERINQHPNAGTHSFSIGVTEVLNTNLLIELSADDIEYVYQRSPGDILNITAPTFEALAQFGTATIMTKNTGELEASYSLTYLFWGHTIPCFGLPIKFDCLEGITRMEEQFFIMKPGETVSRTFKLSPTTDKAAKYQCTAILKDSDYNEADRAECQFVTTATIRDSGRQVTSTLGSSKPSANGFFKSIKSIWNAVWDGFIDFITGKTCRSKCSGFFDVGCHIQYICLSWIVLFGLFLAIFPLVLVLLWLLRQKGFFDPLHDWWDDLVGAGIESGSNPKHTQFHMHRHEDYDHQRHGKQKGRNHHRNALDKQKGSHHGHLEFYSHNHRELISSRDDHHHHLHKQKHKHGHAKERNPFIERKEENPVREKFDHKLQKKERQSAKRPVRMAKHGEEKREKQTKHRHGHKEDHHTPRPQN